MCATTGVKKISYQGSLEESNSITVYMPMVPVAACVMLASMCIGILHSGVSLASLQRH